MTATDINRQLKALEPKDKKYLSPLKGYRGLYAVMQPEGDTSFALRYTSPETKVRRQCGLIAVTAENALAEYEECQQMLRDGLDPLDEFKKRQKKADKKRAKKAVASKLTVQRACEWYIKKLRKEGKDRTANIVEGGFKADVYPEIGTIRANRLKVKDVTQVSKRIRKRGSNSQANRNLAYMTAAFNFIMAKDGYDDWADVVPDFGMTMNPAKGVQRKSEKANRRSKERTLTAPEVHRLWAEIGGSCMSDQLSLALKMLLSTGQRVEEVLGATWAEIDLDRGEWVIEFGRRKADNKSEHTEPHIIPLEPMHIELLTQAKKYSGRSRWVFPNDSKDGPRTSNSLNQAIRRYCKPQGSSPRQPFEKFTPRDCRRTFKTLGSQAGCADTDLDYIQGHNQSDLGSEHYNRYDRILEKRAAMVKYLKYLTAIIENDPTDNVVELRKMARRVK